MDQEHLQKIQSLLKQAKTITIGVLEAEKIEYVTVPFAMIDENKLYALVENDSLESNIEAGFYIVSHLSIENRSLRIMQGKCSVKKVTGDTLRRALDSYEIKFPEFINDDPVYQDFQGHAPDKRFIEILLEEQKLNERTLD